VRVEVLMLKSIKIAVFWGVASCNMRDGTNIPKDPASSLPTLKVEEAGCCELLVPIYQTTWRHIAVDYSLITE
jgi:hypothetical protein